MDDNTAHGTVDSFDHWAIAPEHQQVISIIKKPFAGPWTDVYKYGGDPSNSLQLFSCFADSTLESLLLSGHDWLKDARRFTPGFCCTGDDVEYQASQYDGFEFIVAEQYFHSLEERQLVVNPEFILLFELYRDIDGNYYSISEIGEKRPAIEFLDGHVRVRTEYLYRYGAAKQMLYVQFLDSRVFQGAHYVSCDVPLFDKNFESDSYNYSVFYGTDEEKGSFLSTICARSIVRPGSVNESGIWPYEPADEAEDYPEFIIKELPNGSYKRFTCKESELNNYFGANPGAPHYLTPVFFKPSVLDRYRKLPNFEVTERRLSCGSQWGIEIDNINPDRVMVYLGDLGRDLPSSERKHFLNYEIPPTDQSISNEAFAQDFLNAWLSEAEGPVGKFLLAYKKLIECWLKRFGRPLFRQLHPDDADLIQRIRIPSVDSQEEFESIVQALAKLLNDYMDETQFPACEKNGSINRLSAFLEDNGIKVDLSPLRDIQILRSTGAAHAKGEKYDKAKARLLTGSYIADTKSLLDSLTTLMSELVSELEG